jgi:branched-chain amino acid transport system substrate-binding protein
MEGGSRDRLEQQLERLLAQQRWSRRRFLRTAGVSGAALGFSGLLAACRGGEEEAATGPTGEAVKIGYVSPRTGPDAPFGESDEYILGLVRDAFSGGLEVAGQQRPIEVVSKDSESNPDRAAQVALDLITDDQVNLIVVQGTPETDNPVSSQCEANGVPCISSVAPWQPWFIGQQADPTDPASWQPFTYAYHFFWGLEDIIQVFLSMWETLSTNKVVGALWPNDGDGNAWSDPVVGFPPACEAAGYTLVDPGRYENGTQDFTAQISEFKAADVEIITGVPVPPDFTNFWTQAQQQGFIPKIASVGKALLFPASVDALGPEAGEGLSTEYWWGPTQPFSSSLIGESAQELADGYTDATDKEWTQPIGFVEALFEVAADVLERTTELTPDAIVTAITETNLDTVVGNIQWTGEPVPNVAKTKLIGAQWKTGEDFPYDLIVVENAALPEVPLGGELTAIPGS